MTNTCKEKEIDEFGAIAPSIEMGAYEALWDETPKASFKVIRESLRIMSDDVMPSSLIEYKKAVEYAERVFRRIEKSELKGVGIRIRGTYDYYHRFDDVQYPLEVVYYQGLWALIYYPRKISIVGSRKITNEGKQRTLNLVDHLVRNHRCAIVSGLAEGVDTFAHKRAIQLGAPTIAVIGTPLTAIYPRSNEQLQKHIARYHLVISQVPFERYYKQDFKINRFFFPQRNITMSAISDATIIVEASDTSGSLTQARAAISQGRKLLIMNSCFEKGLKWPERYLAQGAIRIKDFDDIDRAMVDVWR